MATHSSALAWRIPGAGEPGGLPSLGSYRVGHDWNDLAAAAAANPVRNQVTREPWKPSIQELTSCSEEGEGIYLRANDWLSVFYMSSHLYLSR